MSLVIGRGSLSNDLILDKVSLSSKNIAIYEILLNNILLTPALLIGSILFFDFKILETYILAIKDFKNYPSVKMIKRAYSLGVLYYDDLTVKSHFYNILKLL